MEVVEDRPLIVPWPSGDPAEVRRLPHGTAARLRFYRVLRAAGTEELRTDDLFIESNVVGHQNLGCRQVRGEGVERAAHLHARPARRLRVNPVNTDGAIGNLEPLRSNDEGLTSDLAALGVSDQPRDLNEPRPGPDVGRRGIVAPRNAGRFSVEDEVR